MDSQKEGEPNPVLAAICEGMCAVTALMAYLSVGLGLCNVLHVDKLPFDISVEDKRLACVAALMLVNVGEAIALYGVAGCALVLGELGICTDDDEPYQQLQ